MEHPGFSIEQMKLRAFDLSERTWRRGRFSAVRRADRWRQRAFVIAQCAVTAALAWALARLVPGHLQPVFAPVAAVITLGLSYGARLRRGVEVAAGVAVGVAIGDVWVQLFGTGVWQVAVVVALAMSLATLLGAGSLMTTQAAVQSVFVITLATSTDYAVNRWLDAAIGCAVALLVAAFAPSGPLRKPGLVAARILREMAATLQSAQVALETQNSEAADAVLARARQSEESLAALDVATSEGLAVVRQSPFRRNKLSAVSALAELAEPLDHANRNLRVLARRCAVATWRGQSVPAEYLAAMGRLAHVCTAMADELEHERLPTQARAELQSIAADTAHVELSHSLSAVVILAQTRSIIADLMELTGMDYSHARELIPDLD